jgi:hypothetical protein
MVGTQAVIQSVWHFCACTPYDSVSTHGTKTKPALGGCEDGFSIEVIRVKTTLSMRAADSFPARIKK